MGNITSIHTILNKHKKLNEYKDTDPDIDLIFFNIPITFEYERQSKSYFEQLKEASDEELTNTNYNELYLCAHKVIITSDDIITNVKNVTYKYEQMRAKNNINLYTHFDFVKDTGDKEPDELSSGLKKINDYENEIKELQKKIIQEKQKILNLDYVKSKFNKPVSDVKEYIHTASYLFDKYLQ